MAGADNRTSPGTWFKRRIQLASFRRVIGVMCALDALCGRRCTVDDYLRTEQFGVVEPELDYARSTHRFERLNYMLDDFEGEPIRFDSMVRPVVDSLLQP